MLPESKLVYSSFSFNGFKQIQIRQGWGGIAEGIKILSKELPRHQAAQAGDLLQEIKDGVHCNLKEGGFFYRTGEKVGGGDLIKGLPENHPLRLALLQQVIMEESYKDLRKYSPPVEGVRLLTTLVVVRPDADRFLTFDGRRFGFQVDLKEYPSYAFDFENGLAIKIKGLIDKAEENGLEGFFVQHSALHLAYGEIIKERGQCQKE